MKVGLLSDIHGNADGLAAVLAAAKMEGVQQLLIGGDFVGYYYDVAPVLELLTPWSWQGVRGNHEDMLADWVIGNNREAISRKYGSGIEAAEEALRPEQIQMLLGLPKSLALDIAGRSVLLCHGSPDDTDRYIYPDAGDNDRSALFPRDTDLTVFGHTHYACLFEKGRARAVNPGSVGQPRDRGGAACWALWDTDSDAITLRREGYDTTALKQTARDRDPGLAYLVDVLDRGLTDDA